MSRLHKDFDHALSRVGSYLEGQTANDHVTNVKAYLYHEKKKIQGAKTRNVGSLEVTLCSEEEEEDR